MGEERAHALEMAAARRRVQRRGAAVVLGVRRSAGAQQELDHLGMAFGGGPVQRGDLAVLAAGDPVGVAGQDRADGIHVARVRGLVQVSHPLAALRRPLASPDVPGKVASG